jgi:hypothetical protein
MGERKQAEELIALLHAHSQQRYVSPVTVAVIYAGLGYDDKTMTWLDKAFEERASLLVLLKVWPMFDGLRGELRFIDLLHRIGFLQDSDWRAQVGEQRDQTLTGRTPRKVAHR